MPEKNVLFVIITTFPFSMAIPREIPKPDGVVVCNIYLYTLLIFY